MTNAEKEILANRLIKKLESLGYIFEFKKQTNIKNGVKKTRWSILIWQSITIEMPDNSQRLTSVQVAYVEAKRWTPKQGLVKRNMFDDMLKLITDYNLTQHPMVFQREAFIKQLAEYFTSFEELELRLSIEGF